MAVEEGEEPSDKPAKVSNYVKHGKGTAILTKRTLSGQDVTVVRYDGTFVNDAMTGEGKLSYYDGSVYEGQITSGVFQGKGKYTWPSGSFYDGEFVNGEMHGNGIYLNELTGKFREGVFHRN